MDARSLAADPRADHHEGIVLLKNGHVLRGELRLAGDMLEVHSPTGGRLTIPRREVAFLGANLQAVYQYRARAIDVSNSSAHAELARWCLRVGLTDAARQHKSMALALNPQQSDARSMHELLDRSGNSSRPPAPAVAVTLAAAEIPVNQGGATELGVSPQTARAFVRQIQPILLSRCAGCHSPDSSREFVLLRLDKGRSVPRGMSERNLAAVWAQTGSDPLRHRFTEHASHSHSGSNPWTKQEVSDVLVPWLEARARHDGSTQHDAPARPGDPSRVSADAPSDRSASSATDAPVTNSPPKRDPFDPYRFNRGEDSSDPR